MRRKYRFRWAALAVLLGGLILGVAIACGGGTVVETVVVKETVVVEKQVPVEKVVKETVVVEKQVPVEKVVKETVVVKEQVPVEKVVKQTVVVVQTAVATPTATPAPVAGGPSGDVVWAIRRVNAIYGVAYTGPYRGSAHQQTGGVEEHMFHFENGNPMTPELADSWEVDPAGTKVTLKIHQGIKWQAPRGFEDIDFGDFTAEDVALWLNTGNSTTNPESTYPDAGDLAAVFLEAKALDKYTVEVGLVSPTFFCLPISQFGCLGAARGPYFARGVDMMGLDWAQAYAVGTGPFVQGVCVPGNRCTVHALPKHWRKVANIASLTVIQVPEPQTRVAMLRNGQADMSEMDFKLVPSLIDEGFQYLETMPGGFVGQSVLFPGNLWEEKHARTGEPLNPWDSPSYAKDYPWIGDPWQELHPDKVKYTDTDNPPGMTDMEQARLVRLALGTAIDRNKINEVLLGGLGTPIYSEYMGPEYPGWDPKRDTGVWTFDGKRISPSGTQQSVPWLLPDGDLKRAGELLDEAGYPKGADGLRPIDGLVLEKYPAEAGEVGLEVGDTINSTWVQLGIKVSQLEEDYGGVISPRMRKREQFLPVLKNGDVHSNVFPLDWPYPPVDSSISRPGWGVGFETPYLASQHFAIRASKDRAFREKEHMNTADYILYWQLYSGVFQIPKGLIATDRIKSWVGYQQHYSNVSGNPEFITLNK